MVMGDGDNSPNGKGIPHFELTESFVLFVYILFWFCVNFILSQCGIRVQLQKASVIFSGDVFFKKKEGEHDSGKKFGLGCSGVYSCSPRYIPFTKKIIKEKRWKRKERKP